MNQFIQLSDGTIINVAHVQSVKVSGVVTLIDGKEVNDGVYIQLRGIEWIPDPDGKIYAWFADRAVEIGKEEV